MIAGIGIDITDIDRVKLLNDKYNQFKSKILVGEELNEFNRFSGIRQIEFLAGRFSAKEAYSKALGTGIGKKVSFKDLEILGPNGYKQNVEYTNAKDYYFSNGDIYKIANYYRDGYHQYTGKSFSGYLNDYSFALKTTDKLFDANTAIHTAINVEQFIPIYNSRNQYSTSNLYVTDKPIGYWEQKDDNLTVNDLWQKTLEGHFAFSKQIDGSVIWVVKPTKEQMSIDRNTYYDKIDRSYLANVQDPQHAALLFKFHKMLQTDGKP